ncbi:MAG: DUF3243 domain-containing protein [Bacillota bacterium]
MEINTFDQWIDVLSDALDKAKTVGMSNNLIKKSAVEMGDFLYSHVDPDAPENRALKAIWEVADSHEKEAIANTLIKLCDKHKH